MLRYSLNHLMRIKMCFKLDRKISITIITIFVLGMMLLSGCAGNPIKNDTNNTLSGEESENIVDNVSENEKTDTSDIIEQSATQSANQNTVQDMETDVMPKGVTIPANPIHHCIGENDGTDTTTWNYIYFGSYPQSEETDSAAIAAIDSAIVAGNGTVGADNTGTDVWVDGTKYRRISKDDTNYDGYFDEKPTNNGYRYFKWERIRWRVLDNSDNGTMFVTADSALDCKDYNDEYINITWENSTIRSWLNDSFYNTAFSSSEQNAIVPQNVVNEDNPDYGTEGGNNTIDKVYLLSIGEVTNEDYGFCSDYNTYSASLWLQPSNYAWARGTYTYSNSYTGYNANCLRWALRSPGDYSTNVAYVMYYGWVHRDGDDVNAPAGGVVPALHINLSSDLWSVVDGGTSGEGGNSGTDF